MGFLPKLTMASPTAALTKTPRCGACGLFKDCKSPKMPVAGEGRKGILVVGEAPGEVEDDQGRPFVGPSGRLLQEALHRHDVNLFRDCWVTNAARCRPPKNELPEKVIDHCRPYVVRAIEELKPFTVILLGGTAVQSVLGALGRDDASEGIRKWVGWQIPCQRWNCWIVPTYHPSHILRFQEGFRGTDRVTADNFHRHLGAACGKRKRPWKEVPDYRSEVTVMLNAQEAASAIQTDHRLSDSIAFDFETSSLKPDGDGQIVCCSVSSGVLTYAFPWHGEVIPAMKALLADPRVKKRGWNVKFEHRWVLAKLGVHVRGWEWDGMTTAHALESRKGVTGLKFQAFVRLGVQDYSSHIEPYLEGEGGYSRNRVKEVDLRQLLLYCGMDSLLEYKICHLQMRDINGKVP